MSSDIESRVDAYVDRVWEDVIADIADLVACASVSDTSAAAPGAPFGPGARSALDCALRIAERLGYQVAEDEGYIGWGDIPGETAEQVATIAHVDVVPAGPGWNTDPFAMERRDGWLLGRGVIDDKGPAVLSLYAGAFFLDQGLTPRHTFRALLGCDEEAGMGDVRHYLATHEDPAFLFTPDAEFPVCNAEKGCFGGAFWSAPIEGGAIRLWSGSEATNAIPSESICELAVPLDALPVPRSNADRLELVALDDSITRILAHGIGGHASLPEGTINAVALIVGYLKEVMALDPEFLAPAERAFVDLLSAIHADTAGGGLGIACSNEAFGPLTCNAGVIALEGDRIVQRIDIRYPDAITAEEMTRACAACAERFGARYEQRSYKPPFSVSADSPAVQALLDTYREVTGKPAAPFSMGGGTYARSFKSAVSFGPEDNGLELPSWAGTMHGPNEAASEQLLKDALKMYILALLRLDAIDYRDAGERG